MTTETKSAPAAPISSGFLDCNGFAARQAARFISKLYEKHLGKAGLTGSQFTILSVINRNPGLTMATLAAMLVMDRTSLVRAFKPLARDGFLLDGPSDDNPRQLVLSLTPAGKEKFLEARVYWRAAQDEYEAMLGPERAKSLRDELLEVTRLVGAQADMAAEGTAD